MQKRSSSRIISGMKLLQMLFNKPLIDRALNSIRVLLLPLRASFKRNQQEPYFLTLVTVYNVNHSKAEKTLNSILNQTNSNVHYVFIDDCGPGDHFEFIANKLQNKVNWSYIKNEQNEGVGQALNNGLYFALKDVPKWTHFGRIDLEDWFTKDYFSTLRHAVKIYPLHKAVTTLWSRIEGRNTRIDFMSGIAMYEKGVLSMIGGFDKTRFGVDLEYHMRYSHCGESFAVVPAAKYFATFSDSGLTSLYPEDGEERALYFARIQAALSEEAGLLREIKKTQYHPLRN